MTRKNYDYIIILKHPGYKLADTISLLLCLFTVIFFTYFLAAGVEKPAPYIITIAVIIVQFLINYFKKKQGKKINHNYAFSICFIAWLTIPYSNWVLAVLYLIALVAETQVKFPYEIGVNEEGIIINSFPKKNFTWADFVNVLIKENMLTIDFKNNRILQKETESEVSIELEKEFNEFCKKRITSRKNNFNAA
ncbi:MAG: hypothetical protein ABJA79_03805 [Parafilimonas sp.]